MGSSLTSAEVLQSGLLLLLARTVRPTQIPYPAFNVHERECPDFVDASIFYSSSQVPYGTRERAFFTVPERFQLKTSLIPGAGLGIFSRTFLPSHTWLGEYEGEFLPRNRSSQASSCDCPVDDLSYAWGVQLGNLLAYYVDANNIRTSNWLRFINCARHVVEQNVDMSACYGRIYYRTVKDIAPGQELLAYYGDGYAHYLGIDVRKYRNRYAGVKLKYISP